MESIKPLTAITTVGSATSQNRERSQGRQAPSEGQVLKAVVIEAGGDNRFVLDIGGTRQNVRSEAMLTPGQSLRLQVIRIEPQIELQIIANPLNRLQGRSLTLLGQNIDLAGLMEKFQQQNPPPLASLSTTSRSALADFFSLQQNGVEGKGGGLVLKQLIDSLGLNLEQLLARNDKSGAAHTLKAALLEIAHSLTTFGDITQTTAKILSTLELFQLAQLQVASETQLLLPLPLPFIDQGYLLIEQDGKDGQSSDSTGSEKRFSLHLRVSALGNLQIDFLQNREGLFIRFRVENQEKVDFIATFAEDLKNAIRDIPLINVSFSADAPDPIQDLVRRIVPRRRPDIGHQGLILWLTINRLKNLRPKPLQLSITRRTQPRQKWLPPAKGSLPKKSSQQQKRPESISRKMPTWLNFCQRFPLGMKSRRNCIRPWPKCLLLYIR